MFKEAFAVFQNSKRLELRRIIGLRINDVINSKNSTGTGIPIGCTLRPIFTIKFNMAAVTSLKFC